MLLSLRGELCGRRWRDARLCLSRQMKTRSSSALISRSTSSRSFATSVRRSLAFRPQGSPFPPWLRSGAGDVGATRVDEARVCVIGALLCVSSGPCDVNAVSVGETGPYVKRKGFRTSAYRVRSSAAQPMHQPGFPSLRHPTVQDVIEPCLLRVDPDKDEVRLPVEGDLGTILSLEARFDEVAFDM